MPKPVGQFPRLLVVPTCLRPSKSLLMGLTSASQVAVWFQSLPTRSQATATTADEGCKIG
jgi:hypothetical protein